MIIDGIEYDDLVSKITSLSIQRTRDMGCTVYLELSPLGWAMPVPVAFKGDSVDLIFEEILSCTGRTALAFGQEVVALRLHRPELGIYTCEGITSLDRSNILWSSYSSHRANA